MANQNCCHKSHRSRSCLFAAGAVDAPTWMAAREFTVASPPSVTDCSRKRPATGKVVAFDSSGYSFDPASDVPTEWRHFRRHRFAQLTISCRPPQLPWCSKSSSRTRNASLQQRIRTSFGYQVSLSRTRTLQFLTPADLDFAILRS